MLARTVNGMLVQLATQNVRLENEIAVRRQAEQALHTAQEELESVVEQRTAQLGARERVAPALRGTLRRAMEASDDGLWEWNPPDDQMFMSKRARQLWGLPEGVHVKTRAELRARGGFHPDDVPRIEAAIQASGAQAEGFDIEYRIINPAGETRWVRSRGKAFRHRSQLTGSITDITDRKVAEEALRRSEERFALAVAGSNEGIFDWDLAADASSSPIARSSCSGATRANLAATRRVVGEGSLPPDDLDRQRSGIRAHLAGETPAYEVEFRLILPGSGCRWFRQRGVALRDASGRAYRMAGSIEDVTDRKAAEDEVRLRKEELQRLMDSISTISGAPRSRSTARSPTVITRRSWSASPAGCPTISSSRRSAG